MIQLDAVSTFTWQMYLTIPVRLLRIRKHLYLRILYIWGWFALIEALHCMKNTEKELEQLLSICNSEPFLCLQFTRIFSGMAIITPSDLCHEISKEPSEETSGETFFLPSVGPTFASFKVSEPYKRNWGGLSGGSVTQGVTAGALTERPSQWSVYYQSDTFVKGKSGPLLHVEQIWDVILGFNRSSWKTVGWFLSSHAGEREGQGDGKLMYCPIWSAETQWTSGITKLC